MSRFERRFHENSTYFTIDLADTLFSEEGDFKCDSEKEYKDGDVVNIPLFRAGSFRHPLYGDIKYTEQDLYRIVENFKRGAYPQDIHGNVDHYTKYGALGWISNSDPTSLYTKMVTLKTPVGEVQRMFLFGKVVLNKIGAEAFNCKKYKYTSAEVSNNYTTREKYSKDEIASLIGPGSGISAEEYEDGSWIVSYGPTLVGFAFTNRPFMPGMMSVFSEGGEPVEEAPFSVSHAESEEGFGTLSTVFYEENFFAGKYDKINFKPPQGVRNAAQRGLDYRSKYGRGGTRVGIARARDLANGKAMSPSTIGRMVNFFSRHQKNRNPDKKESDGGPTNGWIAWLLWGGDAGKAWASKVKKQMDAADKKMSDPGADSARFIADDFDDDPAKYDENFDGQHDYGTFGEPIGSNGYSDQRTETSQSSHSDQQSGGTEMIKFSEIRKKMNEAQSSKDKLEVLLSMSGGLDNSEREIAAFAEATLREKIDAEEQAEALANKLAFTNRSLEEQKASNAELREKFAAAKLESVGHQVSATRNKLTQLGFTNPMLEVFDRFFSNVSPKTMEHTFSICDDSGDEVEKVGVLQIIEEIFSAAPNELFSDTMNEGGDEVVLNNFSANDPEEVPAEDPEEDSDVKRRIELFTERYGSEPASWLVDKIREDGTVEMDLN